MGSMWQSIVDNYTYLIDDLAHPLTKGWLLATSPVPLLVILVTYNVFCIKIGPALMQNRPPFKLDLIIRLYNIFQVLISLYIFHECIAYIFSGNFNFKCQGIDDDGLRIASAVNVYLYTKLTELLDTVFFVLRKSYRQITFLHLYHHTLMPIITWVGIKYVPGGQSVIIGTLNSLVHVVMYTYYFIAGLGPEYQKYLWWKKYLTVMQIVQFVILFLHSFNSMFYSCDYMPILKVLTMLLSAIFINMFSKFYYYTYIVKRKSGKSDEIKTTLTNGENTEKEESNKNPIRHRNGFNKDSAVNGDSTKNKYTNGISSGNSKLNDIPSGQEKMKSL